MLGAFFPKAPGYVLVKYARNQGLVRDSLLERSFLQRIKVLARDPDIDASVLLEGRSRIILKTSNLTVLV